MVSKVIGGAAKSGPRDVAGVGLRFVKVVTLSPGS